MESRHHNLDKKHIMIIEQIELVISTPIKEFEGFLKESGYRQQYQKINAISITNQNLTENQLSQIIKLLSKCEELITLGFFNCQLTNIDDFIYLHSLIRLKTLYLANNKISDYNSVSYLSSLTKLNISDNPVNPNTLIKPLNQLKLSFFVANNCRLNQLEFLTSAENIKTVYLNNNYIEDITPLRSFKTLHQIAMEHNNVNEVPSWLLAQFKVTFVESNFTDTEKIINLKGNPITTPPIEIIQRGYETVVNYYEQLSKQQDYLFEAKMLIVGEPGAGKTSLARKINNPHSELPKDVDTTHGIDVLTYHFAIHSQDFSKHIDSQIIEGKNFRVNLWDFGGQKIYLATHRFFLSNRALYVLISDSRKEDTDFNYWLHVVEMFSPNSPILIVLNEKGQREHQLDPSLLNNRFNNIVGVQAVDLSDKNHKRLYQIRKTIRYHISQLPHVGNPLPAPWLIVRKKLEQNSNKTIRPDQYLDICKQAGIEKHKDAMQLSQYFHDIGVFLHFQEDDVLKHTIFLDSNWTTNTIYQLLDDNTVYNNQGIISKNQAKHIWQEIEVIDKCDEFFRLMNKFHLAFEFKTTEQYIVPAKLPIAKPKELEYLNQNQHNKKLKLGYKYDQFMPRGLLFNLMVELQHLIQDKTKIWRQAVLFEKENTQALIIEDHYLQTINLNIWGEGPRNLLIIIMDKLDSINRQYQKIKVTKQIPCFCHTCQHTQSPFFFEYQRLEKFINNKVPTILCEKSFTQIEIDELLAQISNNSARNQIFISYSHKDSDIFERVKTHFKSVKNANDNFVYWHDQEIKAGTSWFKNIKQNLNRTKVAVLLVSADFLASDFIKQHELPELFTAMKKEGAKIIPLLVNDCSLNAYPALKNIKFLNELDKPLKKLSSGEQETQFKILTESVEKHLNNEN